MDAIRALQAQLRDVQAQSNKFRLSERTVVDLIVKLISNGQLKLIHTASGKEYLTPEQVDVEIREAVAAQGGRVAISELPHHIGIGVEHIEARVPPLAKKDKWTVLSGEVISTQYLDSIQAEVDELLTHSGCLQVSALAVKFALPADFLRTQVLATGDRHVQQDIVYTDGYLSGVAARVRGTMAGTGRPLSATTLSQKFSVPESVVLSEMTRVAAEGRLVKGSVQGVTFTPASFTHAQSSKVEDFYSANGYLPLSLVKSVGINKPSEWVKEKYKGSGTVLESVFVGSRLVPEWATEVADALTAGIWVDVAALVPPSFTKGDVAMLIPQLKPKGAPCVIAGTALVSPSFIEEVAKSFEEAAKAAAAVEVKKPAGAAARAAPDDDDDDGGKKKKAKGKKGKAEKSKAEAPDDNASMSWLRDDDLAEKMESLPEDVVAELAPAVRSAVKATFEGFVAELGKSQAEASRASAEEALASIQTVVEQLQLSARAVTALALDETPVGASFFRKLGECTNLIIGSRLRAELQDDTPVTNAAREKLLNKLSKEVGASEVTKLVALAGIKKGAADAAVAALLDALDEANLFCRKVDKKREKSAAAEFKAAAKQALEAATEPLPAVLALLRVHLGKFGHALVFPDEAWAVDVLRSKLDLGDLKDLVGEFGPDAPPEYVDRVRQAAKG